MDPLTIAGLLAAPAYDYIKERSGKPKTNMLESIGGLFLGAGAFGDPVETFRMYAPPNIAETFTPEQQVAYGKQIQSQMRSINSDYRPGYETVQKGILDASTAGGLIRKAQMEQQQMQRDSSALNSLFGGGAPAVDAAGQQQQQQAMLERSALGVLAGGQVAPSGTAPAATNALPTVEVTSNPSRSADAMKYFQAAQYYAGTNRPDLAKKYHDIGISLDPNPEDAIRTLEYLGYDVEGQGEKGLGLLKQLNESKSSKTNVSVTNNAAQGKGDVKYWEALAAKLPTMESTAVSANRTNLALRDMIEMSNKGTFSGMLAPGAVGASQFLQSFGMNPSDKLANTREFQAAANVLVLDFMGAMGGARGFSKEESQILYDAFPKIIDDPKARERIARMLITRNNRVIEEYKAAANQYEAGGGGKLPRVQVEPLDLGKSGGGGWSIKRKVK